MFECVTIVWTEGNNFLGHFHPTNEVILWEVNLTSLAEEMFLLKENSTQQVINSVEHLEKIWPKIKINRSLTSLYLNAEKNITR